MWVFGLPAVCMQDEVTDGPQVRRVVLARCRLELMLVAPLAAQAVTLARVCQCDCIQMQMLSREKQMVIGAPKAAANW